MEIFKLFGSVFVDNEKANREIDKTDQKGESLAGTFGKMGNAAKTAGGFIGGAFVAGIGAAVTGIGSMLFAGDKLQGSLNDLQMQTGATEEEMKGMEQSLKQIYRNNYGESFKDIADAMSNVSQVTTLGGKELEKFTQNALMLRDTFEYEVNESTRAADQLMKQFGVTGEEAFTLIAQATHEGANKNGDLLDTINEYSVQFKSLGFGAQDMFDSLIEGAQNGAWSIDKVGDSIKEFNIRAKDGSDMSREAFESLGFNADEMFKSFSKGGEDASIAFGEVMTALNGLDDPLAKNQIGVALLGRLMKLCRGKIVQKR